MKDIFSMAWIIQESRKVLETYSSGITLRQLYYRLVAQGMTNDLQHYKRVVSAMTSARWAGSVEMEAFIDRERSVYGRTESRVQELDDQIESAKISIKSWLTSYYLERWSNQPKFIEVWIEKKALQGVFEQPCREMDVALAPCKGYPSLTFLNEASKRFKLEQVKGKEVTLLYFGDYDPSGEDIPRSIKDNLERMECIINVERIALNPDLIKKLKLPSVPPKKSDSRSANWDGLGAVELDAVEPNLLKHICAKAINQYFDIALYAELQEKEEQEKQEYRAQLKEFVSELNE